MYGDRLNQVDLARDEVDQVNRATIRGIVDLYNLFNVSPVLTLNQRYGPAWQQPFITLPGRFAKVGSKSISDADDSWLDMTDAEPTARARTLTSWRRFGHLVAAKRQQGCRCVLLLAAIIGLDVQAPAATQAPAGSTPGRPLGGQTVAFTHITIEQGLSDQRVQALVQDRAGFMWFGTNNGLNRYDGYTVVEYRNDPANPHSLSGNLIEDIYEDRSGTLWVGTRSGLNAFDRRTERFTRYRHDPANPRSLSDNSVLAIYEDRSRRTVAWDVERAQPLRPGDRSFTVYRHDPADPHSLSHDTVRVITEDRAGSIVGRHAGWAQPLRPCHRFLHHLSSRSCQPAQPEPRCRVGHPRGSGRQALGGDRWRGPEPLRSDHQRLYPLSPRSRQRSQSQRGSYR